MRSCSQQKSKDLVVKVINQMGRTIPSSELENSAEMSHPRSKHNRYFKVVLMQQYSLRFHLKNRLSGEMYQVFLYCENIIFLIYHISHCFLQLKVYESDLRKLWQHFAFNITKELFFLNQPTKQTKQQQEEEEGEGEEELGV